MYIEENLDGYFILEMIDKLVSFYNDNITKFWKELVKYFQWILVNLQIQFIKNKCIFTVFQKEVFMVNFGVNIGSEYRGIRPAIIVSSWSINKGSIVLAIPCSTHKNKLFKYDILVKNYEKFWFINETIIKISHLSSISKKRLIKKIWIIDQPLFDEINKQFSFLLNEKTPPREF